MKAKKYLYWGIVIALILPPILNWILRAPSPFNVPIVGESSDWLLFWGSYLGGIIATLVGLVTLFVTLRQNTLSSKIDRKESALRSLLAEITHCMKDIDYPDLCSLVLKAYSVITVHDIEKEIERLNGLYQNKSTNADLWSMMYEYETDSFAKNFNEAYLSVIRNYLKTIDDLTVFYGEQIGAMSHQGKSFDYPKMNEYVIRCKSGNEAYHHLVEAASKWIEQKRKEIEKMKDDQEIWL